MDDYVTKANDLFPTQTQIENPTLEPFWLECATCPCNKQTPCMCHTRQERRPHKEFTTACNIHKISNIFSFLFSFFFSNLFSPLSLPPRDNPHGDADGAPPDTTTQHKSAQHELALCDRCHTAWAERSGQDTNCDDNCSSFRGGARGRHHRVELSAMRDPATAIGGCRTRPLTLGFGSARLEGAARPPRGAGDALAWCRCNNAEGSNAAVPDAVLEVYLEHLLIMTKDELRVNNPMSCLTTTKSVDSEFQCVYKLGGAVQVIIPEFLSPEIGHETTRNLKRTMQDRVVTMNRMQQSSG